MSEYALKHQLLFIQCMLTEVSSSINVGVPLDH